MPAPGGTGRVWRSVWGHMLLERKTKLHTCSGEASSVSGSFLRKTQWAVFWSEELVCVRWDLAPSLSLSGAKQTLWKVLRLITMHLFKQTSRVWIKVIPLMCPQKPLECFPHESAEERCRACLRIAEWYKSCNYGVSVAFRLPIRQIKPCCIFALNYESLYTEALQTHTHCL